MALGGNSDKTGEINMDKLRSMIEKFELTIDIEGLIEETDKACFFLSLVSACTSVIWKIRKSTFLMRLFTRIGWFKKNLKEKMNQQNEKILMGIVCVKACVLYLLF